MPSISPIKISAAVRPVSKAGCATVVEIQIGRIAEVVETHQGNVVGNLQTGFPNRPHRAHGQPIADGENCASARFGDRNNFFIS